MLSTSSFVAAALLFLAKEINCCVVLPREILTTVGEVVSLACNARPNNEQRGSVLNMKLHNEGKSETVIFQAPVYSAMGQISTRQFVADGYFLSGLDEDLVYATIQINETQLKHGGQYVCSCTPATVSTGSANLVVLADKPFFVLNRGGNPQTTPGTLLDLSCSLSYSGSISSVSVDLTISDANGIQLATERNLSLTESQGSHRVNYSFIAHGNKEQNFTCEMKVWNQSSSERRLLRSIRPTSHYCLNCADKLSFVLNGGGNPQTPEAQLNLSCSLSFSDSISSVSVDLAIYDENGTQLAAKGNLSPTESQGSHRVNYSFIAHGNKNQSFTCEMKAWNQSSSERRLLRSITSGLIVSWGEYITLMHDNRRAEADFESLAFRLRIGLISACCVIVILLALVILMYNRRHRLSVDANKTANAQPNYESIDNGQRIAGSNEAYEELNLNDHSIQTGHYIEVIL